jgi:hypothetical protein
MRELWKHPCERLARCPCGLADELSGGAEEWVLRGGWRVVPGVVIASASEAIQWRGRPWAGLLRPKGARNDAVTRSCAQDS